MPTLAVADPVQERYNYSASFAIGPGGVGGGVWMSVAEARAAGAAILRDPRYDPLSVTVIVQVKKSRWLHSRHGPVADLFPDIWRAWRSETAIEAFLAEKCLALGEKPSQTGGRTVYRAEVDYELKTYGLASAIVRAEHKVVQAQALLSFLQGAQIAERNASHGSISK